MSLSNELHDRVEKGKKGLNTGALTGHIKLDKYIDGIQKGTYYLIGGSTGTGKTAFVDDTFVLRPYSKYKSGESKFRLKVFYYSLEVEKIRKIAKWMARDIFVDNQQIVSFKDILSVGEHDIKSIDKLEERVKERYDIVDDITQDIFIYDFPENPTGIYKTVRKYMEENGKIKKINYTDRAGKEHQVDKYIPNDPYEIVVLIVDHIGLMRRERGFTKKQNIDKLSEYCILLRNTFDVSPVLISQFNRDLSDIDRQRFRELTPQLEDFKDSGNPSEDCNIAMTLFSPQRYNMTTYAQYKIDKLGSRFRSLSILKNRDGDDSIRIGYNFLGECGYFRELPRAIDMNEYESLYYQAFNFEEFKFNETK